MNDIAIEHLEGMMEDIVEPMIKTRLDPEKYVPGESFTRYYGREADAAFQELAEVNAKIREREEVLRRKDEQIRQNDAAIRQKDAVIRQNDAVIQQNDTAIQQKDAAIQRFVTRRRQRGTPDNEIAEDLGLNLADFHRLCPPQG